MGLNRRWARVPAEGSKSKEGRDASQAPILENGGLSGPLSASVVRNDISYLQHLLRPAEDAFLHLVLHIWHKMTTFT